MDISDGKGFEYSGVWLDESGYCKWRDVHGDVWHLSRYIYNRHIGKVPGDWIVWHVDGNKLNNVPDNLVAVPQTFLGKLVAMQQLQNRHPSKAKIIALIKSHWAERKAEQRKRRLALESASSGQKKRRKKKGRKKKQTTDKPVSKGQFAQKAEKLIRQADKRKRAEEQERAERKRYILRKSD